VTLTVPDRLVERIAERAAEIALARLAPTARLASPFLSVAEAAAYLRAKPQRVYDLLSAGRLTRFIVRDYDGLLVVLRVINDERAPARQKAAIPRWNRIGRAVCAGSPRPKPFRTSRQSLLAAALRT
jgi:hypothetical protein